MNKKFLSVTLFSALMIGATGTFTSCKDYDDDIKNLQEQLDKKASLEELAAKVSTLETAVNDAKTAANEAKDKTRRIETSSVRWVYRLASFRAPSIASAPELTK